MDDLIKLANQGWVGALLGVLGIIWGVYATFRKSEGYLAYQYRGQNLIRTHSSLLSNKITVFFGGELISTLTLTQIIIWNNGRSPLRLDNLALSDPPGFEFGECFNQILQYDIVIYTNKGNNFKFTQSSLEKNKIYYTFDFLNPGDGISLNVLHNSSNRRPMHFGSIIGGGGSINYLGLISSPINVYGVSAKNRMVNTTIIALRFSSLVIGIVGMYMGIVALFPEYRIPGFHSNADLPSGGTSVILGVGSVIYIGMALALLAVFRRRYPARLSPDLSLPDDRSSVPAKL